MTHHIFFSWQSDIPDGTVRSFIQYCLERAIRTLQADADIDPADRDVALDQDTLNVPGSPPIMETIFGKIDRAAVFVSDLTYVADRIGGGRSPNPNVCIEHGYALKVLGWRRMVAVMNTAMGDPDQYELPFDVRHIRRPIPFSRPKNASAEADQHAGDDLTKQLVAALKAIFEDEMARAAILGATQPEPDPRRAEAEGALAELALDANRGGVPAIVTPPRLTLRLAPFAAAEGRRLDPRQVSRVQLRFPPSIYGPVESDSDGKQWWSCAPPTHVKEKPNPETSWLMRLVRPGHFESQRTIGRRIGDDPQILVDGLGIEALIVRTLERIAKLAIDRGRGGYALAS